MLPNACIVSRAPAMRNTKQIERVGSIGIIASKQYCFNHDTLSAACVGCNQIKLLHRHGTKSTEWRCTAAGHQTVPSRQTGFLSLFDEFDISIDIDACMRSPVVCSEHFASYLFTRAIPCPLVPHVTSMVDMMQVFQAPSRRGGEMQLIAEYEGLGDATSASTSSTNSETSGETVSASAKETIPVLFYGQHYDALLDENLKPAIRSKL